MSLDLYGMSDKLSRSSTDRESQQSLVAWFTPATIPFVFLGAGITAALVDNAIGHGLGETSGTDPGKLFAYLASQLTIASAVAGCLAWLVITLLRLAFRDEPARALRGAAVLVWLLLSAGWLLGLRGLLSGPSISAHPWVQVFRFGGGAVGLIGIAVFIRITGRCIFADPPSPPIAGEPSSGSPARSHRPSACSWSMPPLIPVGIPTRTRFSPSPRSGSTSLPGWASAACWTT